ncbi:hypothetical protein BpHYR1_016513 [Brachionus plicatilis]|uniref:Uncharacterized protein n=1 Tax=Brachionus plicatilis TaxID=10195 RepID=A0A3M7R7P0_BRAPC|nr:hypothetical protein BpHYR1_016513 [Brachionus plicatilis]
MCPPRPWAASEHSITADNCGYPTPVLILVVHTEPGPIPTLTISAPDKINSSTISPVTTLPAIMCSGFSLAKFIQSSTLTCLATVVNKPFLDISLATENVPTVSIFEAIMGTPQNFLLLWQKLVVNFGRVQGAYITATFECATLGSNQNILEIQLYISFLYNQNWRIQKTKHLDYFNSFKSYKLKTKAFGDMRNLK